MRLCVIGDPVGHSLSPLLHRRMLDRAEYKRRQAAPVLKVSPRAFGMGRRSPIARVAHEADPP